MLKPDGTFMLKPHLAAAFLLALLATPVATPRPEAAGQALPAARADQQERQTALDRYVSAPDPSYRYEEAGTIRGDGYTAHVLRMVSQSWRSAADVDRPEWHHWLTIVRPERVTGTTGLLFIGGSNNKSKVPATVDPFIAELATATGTVVAELRMVPNQPLVFAGETKERSEDALIAYTWDKFLRTGDERWPARLPMTKSAVRALDTITAFCATPAGGQVRVERFVVSGASKRGWTTWTTAAVDRRVVAIMPLVIDLLNIDPSFDHHWRAYGFWAPAIKDYEEMQIMNWRGTPQWRGLMAIEEPYEYRDRLTMPKFIVNSSGDQFFVTDSSRFYFSELKGEKYLRYVPNTDHALRKSDARESLLAFYSSLLRGTPRPRFTWKVGAGGIHVKATDRPTEVKLWQATNPETRDFRLETIGAVYTSALLGDQGGGAYLGRVARPRRGWTAYFVELTYPSGGKYPFKFTTDVHVVPETLPFRSPKLVPPSSR